MQQIIIVEDDQIIREELQIFLSKYGYDKCIKTKRKVGYMFDDK